MATFLQLYGTKLDRELGSSDRVQLFTVALRKEYVNEGQQKFNEQTGCYTRRATLALSDETSEYDLESSGVLSAEDYLWPSKVGASIKRTVTASGVVSYVEGDDFQFITEDELNDDLPSWRAHTAGVPSHWFLRADAGVYNVGLYVAPDIPATETWQLLWPYVAKPADMSADGDIAFAGRLALAPYHDAVLHYAAAQCEKLRKNWDGVERQMKMFAAHVAKYKADQAPPRGTQMRFRTNYALRQRMPARLMNPMRYP